VGRCWASPRALSPTYALHARVVSNVGWVDAGSFGGSPTAPVASRCHAVQSNHGVPCQARVGLREERSAQPTRYTHASSAMEVGLTPALSAEAQRLLSPAGVTPFNPTKVFHAKLALGFAKNAQPNLRVNARVVSNVGWVDAGSFGGSPTAPVASRCHAVRSNHGVPCQARVGLREERSAQPTRFSGLPPSNGHASCPRACGEWRRVGRSRGAWMTPQERSQGWPSGLRGATDGSI
jgi:hypothetical protein